MPDQVFTAGQILTASQMSTLQTNIGLSFIKTQALTGTATNVTACFSATYTNYLVTFDSLTMNATGSIQYQLLSGTTPATTADYTWSYNGLTQTGASANSFAAGITYAFIGFENDGANNTVIGATKFDLYGPFTANRTFGTGQAAAYASGFLARSGITEHNVTSSYDGIRIITNSAATMTGNCTVYGYRKS